MASQPDLRPGARLVVLHFGLENGQLAQPGAKPGVLGPAVRVFDGGIKSLEDLSEGVVVSSTVAAWQVGRRPEYEAAPRIRPDHADAHVNWGNTLVQTSGRLPEAIAEYEAALRASVFAGSSVFCIRERKKHGLSMHCMYEPIYRFEFKLLRANPQRRRFRYQNRNFGPEFFCAEPDEMLRSRRLEVRGGLSWAGRRPEWHNRERNAPARRLHPTQTHRRLECGRRGCSDARGAARRHAGAPG